MHAPPCYQACPGLVQRRAAPIRSLPFVTDPGASGQAAGASTALLTDHYELTMLAGALRSGAAQRRSVFEVFARYLPYGRRYGVVAGTGRLLEALRRFRFGPGELEFLQNTGVIDAATLRYLESYRFSGDIWGYAEGDCYFPGSPILVVEAPFAEAVVLETLILSVLNHDCAIASAASRMVAAAGGRPLIEMGSRRTHEWAAVASARAAYLAGFATTSNLQAGLEYGVPTRGTSAHAFTLVHDSERQAFQTQLTPRAVTRPCWWTPTTWTGRCGRRCSWPGRAWARSGSTAATCRWWPGGYACCSTSWGRTGPGSCSPARSEERRVGKECERLCRSRWSPYH